MNLAIIIVAFTVIEGLRFGRGIDYNIYVNVYDEYLSGTKDFDLAFCFDLLCRLLSYFDLSYQCVILLCSFFLILCGSIWLKRYPEVAFISFPWFYLITFPAENLFRWYTAFAFLLISLVSFFDDDKRSAIVFSILSIGFHVMIAPFVLLCYVLLLKKDILLNPRISLILYIIFLAVWSNSYMMDLSSSLNLILSLSDHYSGYQENLDDWLTGDVNEVESFSLMRHMLNLIMYFFLLFRGREVVQGNRELTFFYNLMTLGIILYPAMSQIELMDRYNQIMIFPQCVIGAYCINTINYVETKLDAAIRVIGFCVLLILGQNAYKRITPQNVNYTYYIWNADGRTELPEEDLKTY